MICNPALKNVRPLKTWGFVIPQSFLQACLLRIPNPQILKRLGHFFYAGLQIRRRLTDSLTLRGLSPCGLTRLAWAITLRTHSPYGLTHLDSTPSHALKGQKLLAQGIALGNDGSKPVAL